MLVHSNLALHGELGSWRENIFNLDMTKKASQKLNVRQNARTTVPRVQIASEHILLIYCGYALENFVWLSMYSIDLFLLGNVEKIGLVDYLEKAIDIQGSWQLSSTPVISIYSSRDFGYHNACASSHYLIP